jgi:hypothetical protein
LFNCSGWRAKERVMAQNRQKTGLYLPLQSCSNCVGDVVADLFLIAGRMVKTSVAVVVSFGYPRRGGWMMVGHWGSIDGKQSQGSRI